MSARIGVIGCGWWSTRTHLPTLIDLPDAEIVGIADPDGANLVAAAERFEVESAFSDYREMLDSADFDGVVVATPHELHFETAKAALEHGCHVMLEKPMVIEPAHGRELISVAAAAGVELIVGYPYNYNAQALAIRELISAGGIGKIELVSGTLASTVRALYEGEPEEFRDVLGYPVNAPGARTYSNAGSGGQGYAQLTHVAALMFWVTGLDFQAASSFLDRSGLAVDLSDAVAIRFADGSVGVLSSTGSVPPGVDDFLRLEIFGDRGYVLFDVNSGVATVHDEHRSRPLPSPPADLRVPSRAPVANLVGVALGREPNGSPPGPALSSAELVAAMHQAAGSERAVTRNGAG